jgi:TPR repeat protein
MTSNNSGDNRGDGDPINKPDPITALRIAADQGDPDAQFQYGRRLRFGHGGAMDESLGVHYYKLSADQLRVVPREG